MRKQYKTYFIPILVLLMLILPNSNIIPESTFQLPKSSLTDDYSVKKPSLKHQQTINPNKTFLPKINLTVSSYIEYEQGTVQFQDTFNATVLSLNRTHWFIHCDYSIPTLDEPSFDSVVNRTSTNHGYEASNYWEWHSSPSPTFDFWMDTTGFYDTYQFVVDSYTVTVFADTIKMAQIDQEFNAWKINAGIFTYWYAVDSGLFLCGKEDYTVSIFWYNLTRAEIAQVPLDYSGPYLSRVSHSNNSKSASNTLISFEFASPYGVDIIYYHWDTNQNSTSLIYFLNVNLLEENGSHDIFILAFDNVGYYNSYHLIYITDDTLPGISLLTPRNNSKIRGSTQIQLLVSSGNGSLFFQWDGGDLETVDEDTYISVPNPELEISHFLNVSVKNLITGLWANARYLWIVDNSPPKIKYKFVNNSVIKGNVEIIIINASEDINLAYKLENKINKSAFIETGTNYTISYSNLENGSYRLELIAEDEAKNNVTLILYFSIYASSFDWSWVLEANSARTLDIVDDYSDLWFRLSIASKNTQNFNLSVLPEDSTPTITEKMEFAIELNCEEPDEIIFITFALMLSSDTNKLPVYQWVYWDIQSSQWLNISTVYNEVSNSWEATYDDHVPYFALINTGTTTSLQSITPGGGQIPSFEIFPTILSLIMISCIVYGKRKSKKIP